MCTCFPQEPLSCGCANQITPGATVMTQQMEPLSCPTEEVIAALSHEAVLHVAPLFGSSGTIVPALERWVASIAPTSGPSGAGTSAAFMDVDAKPDLMTGNVIMMLDPVPECPAEASAHEEPDGFEDAHEGDAAQTAADAARVAHTELVASIVRDTEARLSS